MNTTEMEKDLNKVIWRVLSSKKIGIHPNTPFRCDDTDSVWYKVSENCLPFWDAGTNRQSWHVDWVTLIHLLKGILKPRIPEEEKSNKPLWICSKCHNPLDDSFKHCPGCGAVIDW